MTKWHGVVHRSGVCSGGLIPLLAQGVNGFPVTGHRPVTNHNAYHRTSLTVVGLQADDLHHHGGTGVARDHSYSNVAVAVAV